MPKKAAGDPTTSRIAVTPETLEKVKAVAYGLRMNQNQTIDWLIQRVVGGGDPETVARQFRESESKNE